MPINRFNRRFRKGGEIIEYAIISGLIVIAAIAVISAIGNKVLMRWDTSHAPSNRQPTNNHP